MKKFLKITLQVSEEPMPLNLKLQNNIFVLLSHIDMGYRIYCGYKILLFVESISEFNFQFCFFGSLVVAFSSGYN